MASETFRLICRVPTTIYLVDPRCDAWAPFATAKPGRTYPFGGRVVVGGREITILDPVAFENVPKGHALFTDSSGYEVLQPRPTNIDALRAIAEEQASRYRGAA